MAPSRSLLLLALLAVSSTTAAPTDDTACPRGCRCFAANGEAAANCSSPTAALALGARLRVLRLSRYDDHLSVKEGAFRALSALRELHLDHLGLVKVYPGAFRGLPDLETLDLSHNALSAGDEVSRALRDLPALRRLSLRGNNFGSSHGVAPALASRTLKFVDLGRCKLSDLPASTLAGLTHVRHVVLDGNFIRDFRADAYPRSVVSIDLSHNDIDRVSRAELDKLENVDSIELAENPLHCTCELLKISYDYNMNKPVVCAYPKQLMGKDLLKIKKHQVCGGHKKVKREAGNELDEELAAEELENDGIVDEAPEEDTAVDTDASENQSQEKLTAGEHEGPETLEDEDAKDPSKDNAAESQETGASPVQPSAPDNEDKQSQNVDDLEDDAGPENIDGSLPAEHSPQDTENMASEDTGNEDDTEREGGHIRSDPNPGPPPEEEEDEDETDLSVDPKQTSVEEDNEDEEPRNTGNEPETVGEAVREDDQDDAEDADNQNRENTAGSAVINDQNEADTKSGGQVDENASQEDIAEQDPPDSLPPSEYVHVQAASENHNSEEQANDRETGIDNVQEEGEGGDGNDNIDAASQLTHLPGNVDDIENNAETEAVAVEGNPVKEQTNNAADRTGEQTENTQEMPNENSDSEEDADVNDSETGGDTNQGAKLKSAIGVDNTEDSDDLDDAESDDTENLEENDSLNVVNNEDILPGSEVHRKEVQQEAAQGNTQDQGNENEDSENTGDDENENDSALLEAGEEVERVGHSPNVVHTSDVGARAEEELGAGNDESEDADTDVDAANTAEDNADTEDGGDADANKSEPDEDGDVVGSNVRENAENTDDETDVMDNTADNADEGNEDGEGNDNLPAGVLTEVGDRNKDETDPEGEETGDETSVVGAVFGETAQDENANEDEERLEEELKEDREHATLGHEDLDNDANEDGELSVAKGPAREEPEDGDSFGSDDETPILPPSSQDNHRKQDTEDGNGEDGEEALEKETEVEEETRQNVHAAPADVLSPQEYEEVGGSSENDREPGGSQALAPTDTEDSGEEEGSGNVLDAVEGAVDAALNKDDDWSEKTETVGDREDEAVPPLDNAESEEEEDAEDTYAVDANKESPPTSVVAADNETEDETGSGAAFAAGVPVESGRGDEEPASNENEEEEGSGHLIVVPPVHATEEEENEGSGKNPFIAYIPESDKTLGGDGETDEEEDTDDVVAKTTAAPVVAVEEDVIVRHHIPVAAAAPPQAPPADDDDMDEPEKPEDPEEPEIAEVPEGVDRADAGRALIPEVAREEESQEEEKGRVPLFAPPADIPGPEGDPNVEVVADVSGDTKGNVAAANPDDEHADGSEALNEDAGAMNTIASYVVLGAIMLIVVILLGYAVCRSRRQKSAGAREKDAENPGREMHDVNKPLINNHHPAAPEKQPLDETQQPLMTKEQEASLTIEPPEKKPLDKTDAADHKPQQNGGVREVVVERTVAPSAAVPFAPVVNGKAASPESERGPSPVVPVAAPLPKPAAAPASPAQSPTADGHVNGNAVPLANGGSSPGDAPAPTSFPPAAAAPVSPGAVRVVAKELPDAKRPVIIVNRGADPAQQV